MKNIPCGIINVVGRCKKVDLGYVSGVAIDDSGG